MIKRDDAEGYVRYFTLPAMTSLSHFSSGQAFCRVPEEADWSRFCNFAERITQLQVFTTEHSWRETPPTKFATSFFPALMDALSERRLAKKENCSQAEVFQRLRTLEWSCGTLTDVTGCQLFVAAAPRLARLKCQPPSIAALGVRAWPDGLLATLLHFGLSLRHLEIEDRMGVLTKTETAAFLLAQFLQERNGLKTLSLPDSVTHHSSIREAFRHLKDLKELTLELSISNLGQEVLPVSSEAFQNLEELHGSPRGIRAALFRPSFDKLYMIATGGGDGLPPLVSWSFLRDLLYNIGTRCPVLEKLETGFFVNQPEVGQVVPTSAPWALAPLQACSNLLVLDVGVDMHRRTTVPVPEDFNPTDEDWHQLCQALPQLTELWFHCGPESDMRGDPLFPSEPRTSLKTYVHVLTHCPDIEGINISVHVPSEGGIPELSRDEKDGLTPDLWSQRIGYLSHSWGVTERRAEVEKFMQELPIGDVRYPREMTPGDEEVDSDSGWSDDDDGSEGDDDDDDAFGGEDG